MDTSPERKRIAIILALDMAGFSARTESDERAALAAVAALRERVATAASAHRGRIFNTAGDGFMLEFAAASEALTAALDLLTKAPPDAPPIRIGVHVGEVAVSDAGDLLGHGVNVAARLEGLAQPGMALISRAAADLVRGDLRDRLVPRGRVTLDKMDESLEVLALDPAAKPGRARHPRRRGTWVNAALVGAAAAAVVFAGLLAAGVIGSNRNSLRDPDNVNAVAREVMSQLVSNASADPALPDNAYASVLELQQSDASADQAAIGFLRAGEISRAISTLEQFAADLERRGSRAEAASAYARAAGISQFLDSARSMRNARRAFDLEPDSVEAFEMVFMGLYLAEGWDAALSFGEAVIARQGHATRMRAYAHIVIALVSTNGDRDVMRASLEAMERDVRAFPRDDLLQAFAERVRAAAAAERLDVSAALAHAAEARRLYARVPGHELDAQAMWIRVVALSGDWERAWTEGRQFIVERERLGAPPSNPLLGWICTLGVNLDRLADAVPFCDAISRSSRAETERILALLAASEGRLEEARQRLATAKGEDTQPWPQWLYAYDELDVSSLGGDFEAAEESLATIRRLLANDPQFAVSASSELAGVLRTLAVREIKARRLGQGCPMFVEAAQLYRSFGAEPGVAAMEAAQREARCPRSS